MSESYLKIVRFVRLATFKVSILHCLFVFSKQVIDQVLITQLISLGVIIVYVIQRAVVHTLSCLFVQLCCFTLKLPLNLIDDLLCGVEVCELTNDVFRAPDILILVVCLSLLLCNQLHFEREVI